MHKSAERQQKDSRESRNGDFLVLTSFPVPALQYMPICVHAVVVKARRTLLAALCCEQVGMREELEDEKEHLSFSCGDPRLMK